MPSAPSTLAISCGSQITVVTPCGSTQRSNSNGVTSEDSICRCVSMNPATAKRPPPSITLAALVGPVRPDDAVGDDGDVGFGDRAGDRVQQPDVLDDEVGGHLARAGLDHPGQEFG